MDKPSNVPALHAEALWPLPTVVAMTGLSRSTIYQRVKHGIFPAPRKVSARCARWRASEVLEWIRSQ